MEAVARLSCCYELFGNMIIKREIGNREKLKNGLSFSYYACVGPWEAQASSEIAQSPGLLLLKEESRDRSRLPRDLEAADGGDRGLYSHLGV